MKTLSVLMGFVFLATSAFADMSTGTVHVQYSGEIQGLKVEVLWIPNESAHGFVKGPAIMMFTDEKNGSRSTVVNNSFGLKNERIEELGIEWADEPYFDVKSLRNTELVLDYSNPDIKEGAYEFGTDEEAFFFYDINFDGRQDLLLVEAGAGQRGHSSYKAYEFLKDRDFRLLKDTLYQITNKKPFVDLDEATTVDKDRKTISIHTSAGAADSFNEIYTITADGFTKTSAEYQPGTQSAGVVLLCRGGKAVF